MLKNGHLVGDLSPLRRPADEAWPMRHGRKVNLEWQWEVSPLIWGMDLGLREWEKIFCPASQARENRKEEEISSLAEDKEKKKAIRVLIVDDEPVTREIFSEILGEEGYSVEKARDGSEAIEKLQREHFHLVFLDIKLPDINGVEVFRMMKKIAPKTVAIMMTAYSVEDLIKEALELGAYTCIHKPFNIDEMLNLVKKITS